MLSGKGGSEKSSISDNGCVGWAVAGGGKRLNYDPLDLMEDDLDRRLYLANHLFDAAGPSGLKLSVAMVWLSDSEARCASSSLCGGFSRPVTVIFSMVSIRVRWEIFKCLIPSPKLRGMTAMGHEDQFLPPRLSGRCGFQKQSLLPMIRAM